jgi:predicted PurR-regulated permease PerM
VDTLDRFMPRFLASLLSVLAAVAVVVGVALVILPPLALAFVRFAVDLPTSDQINQALQNLQTQLGSLPEGSAAVLIPILDSIGTAVKNAFAGAAGSLDDIVRGAVQGLLNAVGALLGLIVLPTWMLTVLSEKQRAKLAVDNQITPGLRKDFWAVLAIVDRAAGAYLRGYILAGVLVGFLAYVGLSLSPRLGGPEFQHASTLAVFAGLTQVIPIVGPILGLLPVVLAWPTNPDGALVYLVAYIAARVIGGSLLGARLMERRLGVHPAILVPGVVLIGQFGLLWLLLSAPIVAIAVDLTRYIHGRLSEPPKPAGVLPRATAEEIAAAIAAPPNSASGQVARVPSVYQPAAPPPPIVLASQPEG